MESTVAVQPSDSAIHLEAMSKSNTQDRHITFDASVATSNLTKLDSGTYHQTRYNFSQIATKDSELPMSSDVPREAESTTVEHSGLPSSQMYDETKESASLSDDLVRASTQFVQLQRDVRQSLRQVWTTVQRLHMQRDVSENGVKVLHSELSNILRSLSAEQAYAESNGKSGSLRLLEARQDSRAPSVDVVFGGKSWLGQRILCSISEENCMLDMTLIPSKGEDSDGDGRSSVSSLSNAQSGFSASLSWLLGDAFSGIVDKAASHSISLEGCTITRQSPQRLARAQSSFHESFHILFPNIGNVPVQTLDECSKWLTFRVYKAEDVAKETEEWMDALKKVSMSEVWTLRHAIDGSMQIDQYATAVKTHLPIEMSIAWLQNHEARRERNNYQSFRQVQRPKRRRSLSVAQIMKDLDRDKLSIDGTIIHGKSSRPQLHQTRSTDSQILTKAIQCLLQRLLSFYNQVQSVSTKNDDTGNTIGLYEPDLESRGFAFAERVLRSSSRTETGGDIYDAIALCCSHKDVMLCPESHKTDPVNLRIITNYEKGSFEVETQASMQFKLVYTEPLRSPSASFMANMDTLSEASSIGNMSYLEDSSENSNSDYCPDPQVCAIVKGSLTRRFTFGKVNAPGTIRVSYVADDE